MVNTKKFPREYGHGRANYINGPRVAGARSLPAKTDQAISKPDIREVVDSVRPGPGHKQQASSDKQQATDPQASSDKHQAPSCKHQASSRKRQAP